MKIFTSKQYRLSVLIFLITIRAGIMWADLPIGGTGVWFAINIITIYTILGYRHTNSKNKLINIYILWVLFELVRGAIIADNYWEWKQLITAAFSLSLPLFIYPFSIPIVLQKVLSFWFKYAIPFFILFIFFLPKAAYHFYLSPLLLIACFLPILPKRWRILTFAMLMMMVFADFSARSQLIKAVIALLMSATYVVSKYISKRTIEIAHWICYISPIVLLFLGISGQFNIFDELSKNEGKYVQVKKIGNEFIEEDLSSDTRTFIYSEVITSALRHNYILLGRSPARGNDSAAFGSYSAEDLKTGKYERHFNEVCHPNIFTWLGLIGMFLYSLFYLRSSYLAVYRSNNLYIKLLGVFIAFRWAYGWIEDMNTFEISSISIWMMIAMGFSESFRRMNNMEFKLWITGIFK